MAVDTRNKRASVLHHSQAAVPLFPNPDGSLANAADRQHIGLIYAGIAVSAPVAGATRKRQRRRWKWHQSWSASILAVIMDKILRSV